MKILYFMLILIINPVKCIEVCDLVANISLFGIKLLYCIYRFNQLNTRLVYFTKKTNKKK